MSKARASPCAIASAEQCGTQGTRRSIKAHSSACPVSSVSVGFPCRDLREEEESRGRLQTENEVPKAEHERAGERAKEDETYAILTGFPSPFLPPGRPVSDERGEMSTFERHPFCIMEYQLYTECSHSLSISIHVHALQLVISGAL